ncbi:Complement C3 [Lamellibrachia satsuma]|nr:Complement C3 [Lamellibrachia satsuma]
MYIVVELPKTAVRGEQLGVQVAIFNNGAQPVEALLTLKGSKQYDFVTVQEGGQVSSYNPRTVGGRDIQTLVPLQPGDNRFVHFPILPRVLGKVSVTVSAATLGDSLDVTKSVVIRLEGITNEYNTPYLIDLVTKGSVIIPDLELPVPERFVRPEQRKHLYVPGSATAEVTLVGDIVGPGFYLERLRGTSMLGYIHTNAESYIFNFGNNLLWLKYLKTVNQLTAKTLQQTLYNMNKDLQNVYKYVHKSFAVGYYTREVLPCLWSTSLALEFLSMAVLPEWEHTLYIDVAVLNRLALWLTSQQNVTSGAFRSTKYIPDIRLMSNMTGPDGLRLNMSDTAHALVAMVTSQKILTGEAQAKAERATGRAAEYLANNFHRLLDPFEICMVTYALHVANHPSRGEAFHFMKKLKRTDEFVYWSDQPVETNPTRIINTIPYRLPRDSPPLYQSKAVEGTAYALMVYLHNNYQTEAMPIMKWLQTQRNFEAGFDGTQDTLRATQALVEVAIRDTNKDLYNMVVTLEATAAPAWKQTVRLTRGNFATRHAIKVPKAWGSVRAKVQGSGLALLQMSTKVNVEHPEQIEQPPERSFDLEVDNLLFWGRNGSHMEMNICIRWVRTDIAPNSGAAVLEVDIPTGYHVKWAVLQDHRLDGAVRVMLSKFAYHKVIMGIEFLNNSRNCFFIPAERWHPVANMTIQNKIRVYSKYEPAMHNTTLYTTYDLFHLHICQVCGSFQCPYCPFYNRGATVSSLLGAILTLVHLSYRICRYL